MDVFEDANIYFSGKKIAFEAVDSTLKHQHSISSVTTVMKCEANRK